MNPIKDTTSRGCQLQEVEQWYYNLNKNSRSLYNHTVHNMIYTSICVNFWAFNCFSNY